MQRSEPTSKQGGRTLAVIFCIASSIGPPSRHWGMLSHPFQNCTLASRDTVQRGKKSSSQNAATPSHRDGRRHVASHTRSFQKGFKDETERQSLGRVLRGAERRARFCEAVASVCDGSFAINYSLTPPPLSFLLRAVRAMAVRVPASSPSLALAPSARRLAGHRPRPEVE